VTVSMWTLEVDVLLKEYAMSTRRKCRSYFSGYSNEAFKPYYLHVPKTGTSFQRAIVGVFCPRCGYKLLREIKGHPECSECKAQFSSLLEGHPPFRGGDPRALVFMYRSPRERVVSGYFHLYHGCQRLQKRYNISETLPAERYHDFLRSKLLHEHGGIVDYASCVSGCVTNMLTGEKCGGTLPSLNKTALAIQYIQDAAFIGLQERWEASLRLFFSIFERTDLHTGAPLLSFLMENMRPGTAKDDEVNEASRVLKESGFRDKDELLETAVMKKFNLLTHHTSCSKQT